MWPYEKYSTPAKIQKPKRHAKRYYHAAHKDHLTAGWSSSLLSADNPLFRDLVALRSRSRLLAANDPYYKYWLKLMTSNVVGAKGIRLQMKVVESYEKDGSKIFDNRANDIIEQGWKQWCRRDSCTINGRHDFVAVQKMVLKSVLRDGEIFVRKIKASAHNIVFPHYNYTINASLTAL